MALIVLMEDDAATRMLVASVLKKDGYDVMSADNGAAGLALVRAHLPDLVISDVRMPGSLDGLDLLAIVRGEYPALPVIIVSGHLRPSQALADGATQFLAKPYALETMLQAITAELRKPT